MPVLSALVFLATIGAPPKPEPTPGPTMRMKTFQFVALKTAPRPPAMTVEARDQMMKEHLAFLESGWTRGDFLAVGPVGKNVGGWEGLIITRPDYANDEIGKLMATEPSVKGGLHRADAYTLWTVSEAFQSHDKFMDLETVWLGILRRPKDAPVWTQEQSERGQEGHIANINAMAKAGKLYAAGPFERAGDMRGIFVLRYDKEEKVRELFKNDPFISAGILKVELIPWQVQKGVFKKLKV